MSLGEGHPGVVAVHEHLAVGVAEGVAGLVGEDVARLSEVRGDAAVEDGREHDLHRLCREDDLSGDQLPLDPLTGRDRLGSAGVRAVDDVGVDLVLRAGSRGARLQAEAGSEEVDEVDVAGVQVGGGDDGEPPADAVAGSDAGGHVGLPVDADPVPARLTGGRHADVLRQGDRGAGLAAGRVVVDVALEIAVGVVLAALVEGRDLSVERGRVGPGVVGRDRCAVGVLRQRLRGEEDAAGAVGVDLEGGEVPGQARGAGAVDVDLAVGVGRGRLRRSGGAGADAADRAGAVRRDVLDGQPLDAVVHDVLRGLQLQRPGGDPALLDLGLVDVLLHRQVDRLHGLGVRDGGRDAAEGRVDLSLVGPGGAIVDLGGERAGVVVEVGGLPATARRRRDAGPVHGVLTLRDAGDVLQGGGG